MGTHFPLEYKSQQGEASKELALVLLSHSTVCTQELKTGGKE